eukprot:NODE_29_length_33183_cov_0.333666.p15 type:complete len:214 gc:universal NODE_29_length_33183_cov_0.333666:11214-11855(+)
MTVVGIVLQMESVTEEYYSCDFNICADGSGQNKELSPNVVIGDMDSFKEFGNLELVEKCNKYGGSTRKMGDTLVIQDPNQDTTDFQKCLSYVKTISDATKISIFGGLGGRFDHTISVLHVLEQLDMSIPVVVNDKNNTLYVLNQGTHNFTSSDFSGSSAGLFAISSVHVKTFGFKWNIDSYVELGKFISTSNAVTDDLVIECTGRCFLIKSDL